MIDYSKYDLIVEPGNGYNSEYMKVFLTLKGSRLIVSELIITEEVYERIKSYQNIMFMWLDNVSLDYLSDNIIKLYLYECEYFNHPVNNLPLNLKSLKLDCDNFNQTVDYLPIHLEYFYLASKVFNQSMLNLPESLKVLRLNIPNCTNTNIIWPSNLETINLHYKVNIDYLPDSVKVIKLFSYDLEIKRLPKNLEKLVLFDCYSIKKNVTELIKNMCEEQKRYIYLSIET
jgi:hypothetical protein